MPRPPEMTIFAEVSSGRSDFDKSSPTNFEVPGSEAVATFSMSAEPVCSAGLKAVVRTLITFLPAPACTVWMALPA